MIVCGNKKSPHPELVEGRTALIQAFFRGDVSICDCLGVAPIPQHLDYGAAMAFAKPSAPEQGAGRYPHRRKKAGRLRSFQVAPDLV